MDYEYLEGDITGNHSKQGELSLLAYKWLKKELKLGVGLGQGAGNVLLFYFLVLATKM